jgi:acetyl-CoA carboxylase carboxyltransferase component
VLAGLALARELDVPVEWFTVSSGARISMTSGTENMDWVARVLRSIVHFTQDGGEINIVVTGVNVGAQPYFNAEATMLMHTKGILVMTASSSMLLTGKEALDFAGGVSAADNLGIGGYDRVMGPNGQAQYWAADLEQACEILFRHYEHAYREPGEDGVRPHHTDDPVDRDISSDPHPSLPDTEFDTVGEIFSATANPDRKKPFEVRAVMSAVVDRDCTPLERWEGMAGAESAVVWDAHIGGHAACLIGIQARSLPRRGIVPADGPETWSGATLFPRSSKKIARALNAASANRPAVVLANLAGFDGSPESLRELQLEYGAEIGRAVTNFVGPIFFCVLSRYHGGAFVVFSKSLNQRLEVIAVEGAKASVIGGSAAAAVVFAREVANRVAADPRTKALTAHRGDVDADVAGAQAREAELQRIRADIRATVAREFDDIHTIDRALQVGSVDRIVPAARLRAAIVESIGGHR